MIRTSIAFLQSILILSFHEKLTASTFIFPLNNRGLTSDSYSFDNDRDKFRNHKVWKPLFDQEDEEGSDIAGEMNKRFGYVGIIGAPNMGKSSLLNALLKEDLCIATSKPQTTRHAILGILSDEKNGCQLAFLDTPGVIGDPAYKLQESMMEAVRGVFIDSDILLVVTDLYSTPIPSDSIFQKLRETVKPVIVCINKVDLLGRAKELDDERTYSIEGAVSRWRGYIPKAKLIIPTSVNENNNIDILRQILVGEGDIPAALRSLGRPIFGMFPDGIKTILEEEARAWVPDSPGFLYNEEELSDRSERFFCSELIRASLFERLGKELPYCCEVRLNQFREPREGEKKIIRIGADIIVERSSQKGIVIGTGGEKIKGVGIDARKRLQDFLNCKVHLDLSVKVDKDWRSKDEKLKQFGYKR